MVAAILALAILRLIGEDAKADCELAMAGG